MIKDLEKLMDRISSWPEEAQQKAVQTLRAIEADIGVYALSDDERLAVREGLAQAQRGEFASDAEVAALYKRHGL